MFIYASEYVKMWRDRERKRDNMFREVKMELRKGKKSSEKKRQSKSRAKAKITERKKKKLNKESAHAFKTNVFSFLSIM